MTDRRPGDTLTAAQLEVGDIVRLAGDAIHAFDDIVVKNIQPNAYYPTHADLITLARPYAVLTDIVTTAGVGVSIGVEEFTVARDASTLFELRRSSNSVGRHWAAVQAEREAKDAEIARLRAQVTSQAADLKQRGELLTIACTARDRADQNLSLANEALRRERERVAVVIEQAVKITEALSKPVLAAVRS